MTQTEELIGTIDRFLFQNPDNGYSVFILVAEKSQQVTVQGCFTNIHAGHRVTLSGSWRTHPKFGKQFEAVTCSTEAPTSRTGLVKYLGSGLIKGIGPVFAQKLVDHFGTDILGIIDTEPHRLRTIGGIGADRLSKIMTAWAEQKATAKIMVFLQSKGVSVAYATKIYKHYGSDAINVVTQNPYRLADDIWGIGFKTADQLAQQLGFEPLSTARLCSGIIAAIGAVTTNGHLYVELEELLQHAATLLELDESIAQSVLKPALKQLHQEQKIKVLSNNGEHWITLPSYYYSEKGIATILKRLMTQPLTTVVEQQKLISMVQASEQENNITLQEEQREGIMTCLQNQVTVITGGPGTGKTTLIKTLLNVLDQQGFVYRLAAPTGRAAKRMQEGTGKLAMTIHRLLEFDFINKSFVHHEGKKLKLDVLIVDEASMIDVFLAHAILKALPLGARLLLIGDVDQLPSVGAGSFLTDVINSGEVPVVRLEKIFRQAQDSMIIVNAHRINKGEFPEQPSGSAKRDFAYIKEENAETIRAHLERLLLHELPKRGITPEHTIILTPMNRGIVGAHTLNTVLQGLLNPSTEVPAVTYFGTSFKVGDRVMQIRNNYDKRVFNGDTGILESIDMGEKILNVRYPDALVPYEMNELNELVLAYAVSIHKSQGSEYSCVIIPLFMQHFMLLQRNLLYTGITRAKNMCVFIGQPKAIGMAVGNNKQQKRKTLLAQLLKAEQPTPLG